MFYFYTICVTYGYLLRLTFISYQNFAKGFPRSLALIPLGKLFPLLCVIYLEYA